MARSGLLGRGTELKSNTGDKSLSIVHKQRVSKYETYAIVTRRPLIVVPPVYRRLGRGERRRTRMLPMFVQLGKVFLHNPWTPRDAHISVRKQACVPRESRTANRVIFSAVIQAVWGPRASPSDVFYPLIPRFTGGWKKPLRS